MLSDVEDFATHVVATIKGALVAPLARIAALEQREPTHGRDGQPGRDGRDADPEVIEALRGELSALRAEMAELKGKAIAEVPEVLDMPAIDVMVKSAVEDTIAQLPVPQNGKDGESIDPLALQAWVAAEVTKAMQEIPQPKDGTSVTVADLEPLIVAEVAKQAALIPVPTNGRDGGSVVDALIARDGHLVLTLSDGTTKDVGPVVGRDVDQTDVMRLITEEVAKFPKPENGKDGLGFEDLQPVYDEHGRLSLKFVRGEQETVVRVPCVVDRGVYRAGETYQHGDGATFGGSFFIAQVETQTKPEDGSKDWRLAVKRGRDGKDGPQGKEGLPGKPGRDGRYS